MDNFSQHRFALRRWLRVLALSLACQSSIAAETNPVPEAASRPPTNSAAESEQQLRSYLKLQEQLHTTLLAIEQARQEASLEARTNAELLATRLEAMEKSFAQQREQQLRVASDSHRDLLYVGGGIVALGLFALALASVYQSRSLRRLAEVADGFQNDRALLAGSMVPALGAPERLLIGSGPAGGANQTLLTTISRLERRVQELEQTAHPALPLVEAPADANGKATAARNGAGETRPPDHVSLLMNKGQVLLSLGQAEGALACFEEALAAAPNLAEAHLRKGMALEKLRRPDDALLSYDRAIALNKSLTPAYLGKGGIYNQQERYKEALECYEQALRSEAKG